MTATGKSGAARKAENRAHTRTSSEFGPDFCAECSEAVSEWVKWPCSPSMRTPPEREVDR